MRGDVCMLAWNGNGSRSRSMVALRLNRRSSMRSPCQFRPWYHVSLGSRSWKKGKVWDVGGWEEVGVCENAGFVCSVSAEVVNGAFVSLGLLRTGPAHSNGYEDLVRTRESRKGMLSR